MRKTTATRLCHDLKTIMHHSNIDAGFECFVLGRRQEATLHEIAHLVAGNWLLPARHLRWIENYVSDRVASLATRKLRHANELRSLAGQAVVLMRLGATPTQFNRWLESIVGFQSTVDPDAVIALTLLPEARRDAVNIVRRAHVYATKLRRST